jgi:integrase
MSVKVRPYIKRGKSGWEVDIMFKWPDGELYRERVKAPVSSKSGAKAWGEQRQSELLARGKQIKEEVKRKAVPTLEEFVPRFIEGYARANRQKPSTIISKESVLRIYLVPRFGQRRLDTLTHEDIQRLKADLKELSTKTVNNVLTVFSKLLKVAVEWGVLDKLPVTIKLLKAPKPTMSFYDFEEYERLVEAASKLDWRIQAMVLLGGDAGLRSGEILALEWTDVDFRRGHLHIRQSEWQGHVTTPKGGRDRRVPMTKRLAALLAANRHLKGPRVLYRDNGQPATRAAVSRWMAKAQKRAGLPVTRALHVLRHTFCSRLAMRGAPAKAIQELAGHENLSTTQRYMHLSPAAKDAAISLLDEAASRISGDILETEIAPKQKPER